MGEREKNDNGYFWVRDSFCLLKSGSPVKHVSLGRICRKIMMLKCWQREGR